MAEVGQPQLRMQVSLGSLLHAAVVPSGYRVSVLEGSRLPDWIAVLNSVGDLGEWSEQRALQALAPGRRAQVLADAIRIVYSGDCPAATACLTAHLDTADAELGWVAVRPDRRRLGLGRAVCSAVLLDMKARGYSRAFLLTDDHRPAAIGLYWSMGFRPEMTHESHEGRWMHLRERLGLVD